MGQLLRRFDEIPVLLMEKILKNNHVSYQVYGRHRPTKTNDYVINPNGAGSILPLTYPI